MDSEEEEEEEEDGEEYPAFLMRNRRSFNQAEYYNLKSSGRAAIDEAVIGGDLRSSACSLSLIRWEWVKEWTLPLQ